METPTRGSHRIYGESTVRGTVRRLAGGEPATPIYSHACAGYLRSMLRPMAYKRTAIRNRLPGRGPMRARPS